LSIQIFLEILTVFASSMEKFFQPVRSPDLDLKTRAVSLRRTCFPPDPRGRLRHKMNSRQGGLSNRLVAVLVLFI
jgi:hypothetical protein